MTPNVPKIRPAFDTLRELRDGALLDDLALELNRLTQAVQATGKGGSLTLEIKVRRMKNNQIAVVVTDTIKTKCPEPDRPESIMFVTEDNNLQAEHPKQKKLDLRPVDAPAPEQGEERQAR